MRSAGKERDSRDVTRGSRETNAKINRGPQTSNGSVCIEAVGLNIFEKNKTKECATVVCK